MNDIIGSKILSESKEFNYILCFILDNGLGYEACWKQLRSLWTAYCLHHGYQCDTGTYDEKLLCLWNVIKEREKRIWIPGKEARFNNFDLYMGDSLS